MESYAANARRTRSGLKLDPTSVALNAQAVVLIPFGPKGAPKRASAVKAINGSSFSALELLWLAHNLPSYYLWGVSDMAGFVDPATAR